MFTEKSHLSFCTLDNTDLQKVLLKLFKKVILGQSVDYDDKRIHDIEQLRSLSHTLCERMCVCAHVCKCICRGVIRPLIMSLFIPSSVNALSLSRPYSAINAFFIFIHIDINRRGESQWTVRVVSGVQTVTKSPFLCLSLTYFVSREVIPNL